MIVGLFHAGLGVATGTTLLPEIASDFNQVWVYSGFAVIASIVLVITKGKLGYEPEPETDPSSPSEFRFDQLRVAS